MQYALRPYATAGVALVGASIIAVTPVAAPLPDIQERSVKLVDAWSDLITDTTANLQLITNGADVPGITAVFNALATNPLGVIQALTDLTPNVSTELGSLPATINIDLPPGLELALAQLGAEGATLNAINDIVGQLATNPSGAFNTLLEAPANIANAFLNGEDNISLLNGLVNIAGFNGILAPVQDVSINLNLVSLLDALGVGNLGLPSLDLSSLLGLDNLDLGGLIDALGLNDTGLGTLLGNPTLGSLLDAFGLGGFNLGGLDLTNVLGTLGLGGPLNNLPLDTLLSAVGIHGDISTGLTGLLENLGLTSFLNEGLGSVISSLPSGLLTSVLGPLNTTLGTLLNPLLNIPILGPALSQALSTAGLNFNSLLDPTSLEAALDHVKIIDLLGDQTITQSISGLLAALGVEAPQSLTVGGILEGLGFPDTTGALSLSELLGGFSLDNLDLTPFLNGLDLNLSDLLAGLNLADLPLDLSQLGDLTDLTLGGLLGDLGLGDLATINIENFGGLVTQLVDVIPQQILAALAGG